MHKCTPSIKQALILVLLAGVGPSLGCVDLTRPWDKPGYRTDAPASVDDVGGGGGPGDAEDGHPIGRNDDASPLPPDHPADAEQPTPQRDDAGPVDRFPNTSDGGQVDTSPDTSPGKADANTDRSPQPVDSSSDLPVEDSRTEVHDAFPKEDRTPDLNVSLPDSSPADSDVNVSVPDSSLADSFLDTSSPPLDVGREVPAISGLVASYPCESASGAELPDTSGNRKNAVLANGNGSSTPVGFSFGKGTVGNALSLNSGDQAYVSMPRGVLSQLKEMTIATWVNLKSNTPFQRIFDFGVDTNTFMYLTNANSKGFVRFRIVSNPLNKDQVVEGAEAVPVGKWTHIALTLGDNGVSIYLDGHQVAQQAPAMLRPSDLGDTGNNYIGRSQFTTDPYLNGQIDEFRIYDRVLSTAEVGELASGQ